MVRVRLLPGIQLPLDQEGVYCTIYLGSLNGSYPDDSVTVTFVMCCSAVATDHYLSQSHTKVGVS